MERAPWLVGLLFGVSLAIVILLAGPLLLFNPVFTSALQVRHDVAGAFGTTQPEIERVTAGYLADIYLAGPFDAALAGDAPLLDDDERSHMRDVSTLVRVLAAILAVAVVMAAVTGYRLRREPRRQGEIMLMAAGSIGATAVLLGAFFAIAFDRAFTVFHQLLFPRGTWQFDPGSDLITLFPEPFWFDAALAAGAAILLTAIVVSVIGLVRWRSTRDGAAPVSPA